MVSKNPNKKRVLCLSSDEEVDTSPSNINWPRFVVLKGKDKPIPKNPFLIAKSIQALIGEVKSVKHLRDNNLLVECIKRQHSSTLLKLSSFAGIAVSAFAHSSLNSSKGIVRDKERILQGITEQEITEGLAGQGVTHVKRFVIKRDGNTIHTNTYLLTFSSSTLPSTIKAGFTIMQVDLFIPNPLRCYKCQKYGHGASNCTNRLLCHRCGDDTHVGSDCENEPKCVNCKGKHAASDKICPIWLRESKITRIKYEKNISFKEARQLVMNSSASSSYSSVVKSLNQSVKSVPTSSVASQTTTTWLHHLNPMSSPYTELGQRVLYPSKKVQQSTQTPSPTSPSSSCSSTSPPASPDYLAICSMAASAAAIQTKSLNSKSSSASQSSSSSSSQRSRGRTRGRNKVQSDRLHKGEDDPIKTYNQYSSLGEMDVDPTPLSSRPASVSPTRSRRRSPVKHPS